MQSIIPGQNLQHPEVTYYRKSCALLYEIMTCGVNNKRRTVHRDLLKPIVLLYSPLAHLPRLFSSQTLSTTVPDAQSSLFLGKDQVELPDQHKLH